MSRPGRFTFETPETAREALEHFNAFHDGMMVQIRLDSHDRIGEDGSQGATGLWEVTVVFGHYNYPPGQLQPFDRQVCGTFHEAQDVRFDFAAEYLGSPILQLAVDGVERRRGGTTHSEPALALRLGRHFYLENERRFEYREEQLFTFNTGELAEV